MGKKQSILKGRYNSNKNTRVFVASQSNGGCPTVSTINSGNKIKLRDDYGRGFRTPKHFAKLIFK